MRDVGGIWGLKSPCDDDGYAAFGQMTILCTPAELDKLIGFLAYLRRDLEVDLDRRGEPGWWGLDEYGDMGHSHYQDWDPDWEGRLEGDSDLVVTTR